MNFDGEMELERFAALLLESRGAVIQRGKDAMEALLPEDLARFLDTPEHIRIVKEGHHGGEGTYSLNYGSRFLEKMVEAASGQIPLVALDLPFDYLKGEGFERLVKEQFSFQKSVGRVESHAKVRMDYLVVSCRYSALSDEQKEGLFHVACHLESGAPVPHMTRFLSSVVKDVKPLRRAPWQESQMKRIMALVKSQSEEVLLDALKEFRESMNRRFRRDALHLGEYYEALGREMKRSLERPGLSEEGIREREEKISLLPDELARKQEDLFKKYSIRVTVEPVALMLITTPAVKVLYHLAIGKQQKMISLIYNPVTRNLDPLVCQGCGKAMTDVCFCDRLHVLCPSCYRKCPLCR